MNDVDLDAKTWDEMCARSAARYTASIEALLAQAKEGPQCHAKCHRTRCELADGHRGLHLTTKGGGYGWWAAKDSDTPDAWDKVHDGITGL